MKKAVRDILIGVLVILCLFFAIEEIRSFPQTVKTLLPDVKDSGVVLSDTNLYQRSIGYLAPDNISKTYCSVCGDCLTDANGITEFGVTVFSWGDDETKFSKRFGVKKINVCIACFIKALGFNEIGIKDSNGVLLKPSNEWVTAYGGSYKSQVNFTIASLIAVVNRQGEVITKLVKDVNDLKMDVLLDNSNR